MSVREVRATGFEALMLATELLQRARRADPQAGLWEAADVQWWWRKPRRSDDVEKLFWVDKEGPVAGVLLTSETNDAWQCDPVIVPRASGLEPDVVWRRAIEHAAKHSAKGFEVPVSDDDRTFQELARRSGFTVSFQDSTAWMNAADRPAVRAPAEDFVLIDRTQRRDAPHPMRHRNGNSVAQRLDQCPLYDPALDLAVETADGVVAGQGPGRVPAARSRTSDAVRRNLSPCHERRPTGEDLIRNRRSRALYEGVGFRRTSTSTWFGFRHV